MKKQRVRIQDVAEVAGVSPTTVSLVFNGRAHSIPEATKRHVREVALRIGYRPHAAARALATGKTQRIGVILNTPDSLVYQSAYHSPILSSILASLPRYDYNMVLHSAHFPDWQSQAADIQSGLADGAILIGREGADPLTFALLENGFPIVCISYHVDHPACFAVDCDNEGGVQMALEHFLSIGRKRIFCAIPQTASSWTKERTQSAVRFAQQHPEIELLVADWPSMGDHTPTAWIDALKQLPFFPDALLIDSEYIGRNFVESAVAQGLHIPEDIAVITINSTEISATAHPPISSLWQPLDEIAATAVEMLVAIINGQLPSERIRRFPMRLDVRASTVGGWG
ncbi:transcriptional regulator, LacI family [Chthonomonas calidirosea]|uniref:Transcriptional regulator, LacI family n=1 Tax=Chthonomonas calidirosea (strain DSM 23976 / ICMP 18418 / T49) TaxID=1303518 RepID=S0EW29_CHTCT|nr:LacI family DNA-binding transcriptional regulator [Chthonomonas calidirosea]CCW36063.1 transcriptional regulator, LacI family [Chthonomonas calidirosea T49]CEK18444.1 transcriptional regulator, LacI family [Chthonomonas calidirosea]